MNDSQLITACKKGDRNAQKALYERYAPKMMAVCLRYSRDYETARDLLHDGFIQVFQKIASFKDLGSFEGWLRKVFVNIALENYRLEQKKISIYNDYQKDDQILTDEIEEDILEIGDVSRNDILNIIQDMPEGYRTVFNLVIFEDMSHKDIASQLGITEGASRSQFFRAKEFLQKRINTILKKEFL